MSASVKVISLLLPAVVLGGCTNSNLTSSISSSPNIITTANISSSALFTPADVATHNSANSCWFILNRQVYDVTNYIPNHPGGSQILAGCGQDMTSYMATSHKPVDNQLPQFLIGSLKP